MEEHDPTALQAIEHSHRITYPIVSDYTDWVGEDAFREIVQNWYDCGSYLFLFSHLSRPRDGLANSKLRRDDIISSNKLQYEEFKVIRTECTTGEVTEILYKVLQQGKNKPFDPPRCLGYIRYTCKNGQGYIDITNKNALLDLKNLNFGGSLKSNQREQAGAHGEGLKLALLVFMRSPQGHSVRFNASGFSWNFNFNQQRKLIAVINRMKNQQLQTLATQSQAQFASGEIPMQTDPSRGVQVLIGQPATKRNEYGESHKSSQVSLDTFKRWCHVALFLEDLPASSVIETPYGSLLLDRFCGNLYLKGLLLTQSTVQLSATRTGLELKYGYDFRSGRTNRERQSLASPRAEGKTIM